jgi:RNA polymerase sporulation-specific sigma factor
LNIDKGGNSMLFGFLQNIFLFSYVTGSHSFPKPLSPEEESVIINKLKNNEQGAKDILIERNLRLVAHIVKKFNNHPNEIEDLISVGTIGLIKSINSFDTTKGAKFATYASRCIHNEILMYLRVTKKHNYNLYIQEPIGIDKEGNEVTMEDKMADTKISIDEQVNFKMQIKVLYDKIKYVLKGREKTVIELRYGLIDGEEITQREIANRLGISRSYVSRIEKKAIKKLSKEMSN